MHSVYSALSSQKKPLQENIKRVLHHVGLCAFEAPNHSVPECSQIQNRLIMHTQSVALIEANTYAASILSCFTNVYRKMDQMQMPGRIS